MFFLRSFFRDLQCLYDLWRQKERKKNVPFFLKEQKRTQRSFCSFKKNGKECKDGSVLLKRTEKNKELSVLFKRTKKNGTFFWKEQMPNPGYQVGSQVILQMIWLNLSNNFCLTVQLFAWSPIIIAEYVNN